MFHKKKNDILFRLDQVTINGLTYMSPEPMLKGKEQNITLTEKKLWALQNGKLKSGLIDRLSIYKEKLDVLGKSSLYLLFFFLNHSITCVYIDIILSYIVEKQRKISVFRKLFLYPTFMLLLLALTVVTVLLVVQNLLLILIGIKALPLNTRVSRLFYLLIA